MTNKQLNILFEKHGKKSRDFITWAEKIGGIKLLPSEISRHRNGGQAITKAFSALYRLYFLIIQESQNAVEANPLKKLL